MVDVFLSYKAEDRERVRPLAEGLSADGLAVWWDAQIEGGAEWRETIRLKLNAASCVIVVWSEASIGPAGLFVRDEATLAQRRGVYLPIAIDEVDPPLGFGQHHYLRLIQWRGSRSDPRYQDVLAATRAAIAGGPRPIPRAPGRRRAPRRPGLIWGAAAAAVLAVLAIVTTVALNGAPDRLCAAAGFGCPARVALAAAAVAAPNSIAVLPLSDLGGDPAQAYFADGLTDEVISSLEHLGQLQVVGRTSAFKFKGSKENSAVIGQKLGVAYLLDGSVQRAGTRLRVNLSLVDASSGFEKWSQVYDRDLTDVFAVESGIAGDVAQALKVRMPAGGVALIAGGTTNPEAFDAFLSGREVFDKGGDEHAYRAALAKFDSAIAADPSFAIAYTARARVLLTIADAYAPPGAVRATLDEALASARRAVALAPSQPLAQAALGEALFQGKFDFAAARPAFAAAIAQGGGDAQILTLFAKFSSAAGDSAAAVNAARRAVVLDPLNPRAFSILAITLADARRYGEAIEARRRELELNPGRASAHMAIGNALYLQGQFAAARLEYALEPVAFLRLTGEAMVLPRLGDAAGGRNALTRLIADPTVTTLFQQAEVHAQWGERDQAFEALNKAFDARDPGLANLKVDPMLDPIRHDPRFDRYLARLGLTAVT